MKEIVSTYDIANQEVVLPMDRANFYAEQVENFQKKLKPTRAVGIVDVFIFDSAGEVFIQKRSSSKTHNARLFDKTIGGHIAYGDKSDYTVMVETVQELQVPSIVLKNELDFNKTYSLLNTYLNTVAIIKEIDCRIYPMTKNISGENVSILNKVHLYFGVYDGAVNTVDREAKGVFLYSLKELEAEIKANPGSFSYDLIFLMKKYRRQMDQFIKTIKTK